jgi:hypothetical protein
VRGLGGIPFRQETTMSDPTARGRGDEPPAQGSRPSDAEPLVGDTAASRPLAGGQRVQPPERESRPSVDRGQPFVDDDAEAELGHS